MSDPASQDRRARAEAARREHHSAKRKQGFILAGLVVILAVALLGPLLYYRGLADSEQAGSQQPGSEHAGDEHSGGGDEEDRAMGAALADVEEFADLSRNHVTSPVDYPQTPPVGGDHAGVWMNCGAYAQAVPNELAVHSLEHGAVWLAYRPDLSSDDVAKLTSIAANNDYVLVSPVADMKAPLVATAWGKQLAIQEVGDDRLESFVTQFANGPQSPEPGAPCSGGMGEG